MRETPCDYCDQPVVWEFGKLDGHDYRRGIVSRHVCPAPDLGKPPSEKDFCPTCFALKTFCECAQPKPAALCCTPEEAWAWADLLRDDPDVGEAAYRHAQAISAAYA